MNDNVREIYRCLNRCTVNQKAAIILRYIQGMSISETADVLNWSESKVKTTQHRALKAIKKMMDDSSEEGRNSFEEIPLERKRN